MPSANIPQTHPKPQTPELNDGQLCRLRGRVAKSFTTDFVAFAKLFLAQQMYRFLTAHIPEQRSLLTQCVHVYEQAIPSRGRSPKRLPESFWAWTPAHGQCNRSSPRCVIGTKMSCLFLSVSCLIHPDRYETDPWRLHPCQSPKNSLIPLSAPSSTCRKKLNCGMCLKAPFTCATPSSLFQTRHPSRRGEQPRRIQVRFGQSTLRMRWTLPR